MLKGHVFKKQRFGNEIFALFIDTFLNGKNGISNNYKNSMEVTYSGSTLTINSGAVCIQGRFLEEDTSSSISTGTDTAFCKLVIEVDLDKQNTESEFLQGSYKIVKSSSGYPELTQNEIVKNNTGIYQYELARFKTGTSGIIEFQDMRTYLDFDSIYTALQTEYRQVLTQLKQELASVEDGSAYVLKDDSVIVRGKVELPAEGSGVLSGVVDIDYPLGFTKDNCIVTGLMSHGTVHQDYWSTQSSTNTSLGITLGNLCVVVLMPEKIKVLADKVADSQKSSTIDYRFILTKIPSYDVTKGDVNGDGTIDEVDLQMIKSYIMGSIALTEQQFQAADMDNDGEVKTADYLELQDKL